MAVAQWRVWRTIIIFLSKDAMQCDEVCALIGYSLSITYAEELGHLVVQEASAGTVGLDPFAVDDELGDGPFAYVGEYFVGGAGGVLDIDLFEGDVVLGEEALGFAAVAAPGGRVHG
jgi:hypothetical protein